MATLPDLDSLLAVATAIVDEGGTLLEANAGFLRLIGTRGLTRTAPRVDQYFLQPNFQALLCLPPDDEGVLHRGLLTLGEFSGQTRSLLFLGGQDQQTVRFD